MSVVNASDLSPLPYDTVLFDWDGCIANSMSIWVKASIAACEAFGLDPTPEQLKSSLGTWTGVKKLGVTDDQYESFIKYMAEYAGTHLTDVQFYDDAAWILRTLRAEGLKTALVTSAKRANLETPYIRLGGDTLFDAVITAEDVTHHKPHAEPVSRALDAVGFLGGRAIMLGDTENDLMAGQAAGIDTMLIHHPGNEAHRTLEYLLEYNPTHVCTSFKEAATILLP